MANPRVLDKRRKSVRNVRKITRTMELIATARVKRTMERAQGAASYTARITQLVLDLAHSGLDVRHPLLEPRGETQSAALLVITANRGFCGGYNTNVQRAGLERWRELQASPVRASLDVSGKRGIAGFRFQGVEAAQTFTHFEDKPTFAEVEVLANRYLDEFTTGQLDRLDVAYMKFESSSRQRVAVDTLLPLSSLVTAAEMPPGAAGTSIYEFLPSPESILEEVVPTSFKVRLFQCFLDAAVSEQIARMVAMKAATENADELIRKLSMQYNRARQGRITSELMDLIGGVEALK
jgi:F-type H+-transporting ATPase subunit gamma